MLKPLGLQYFPLYTPEQTGIELAGHQKYLAKSIRGCLDANILGDPTAFAGAVVHVNLVRVTILRTGDFPDMVYYNLLT